MDATFLACPICYQEFDLTKFVPTMLPSCGHTLCSECIKKLLQNLDENQRRCPIDKQPFPAELNSVERFKANFLVKEILDPQTKIELCPEHNRKMKVICFTDEKKMCLQCLVEGEHKDHNYKTMTEVKEEAKSQANKIKAALDNLDICYSKARQTMTETKTSLLKRVKTGFEEIKKTITWKEQDFVYQIHSYFYHQEQKLRNMIGEASNARKSLHSYDYDLKNLLRPEDLLKNKEVSQNIQDHLADYRTEVDFQVMDGESEVIKSKIEDVLKPLEEFQVSQKQVWSKLELDLKNSLFNRLALGILNDLPPQSNNNAGQMEIEEYPFMFKLSTSLRFQYQEGKLTISTQELPEQNTFDIEKWKETKNVALIISHKIAEEDVEILTFILRCVKGTSLINLKFDSNGLSQKILQSLAQTPLLFTKAEISLRKFDLTGECIALLLGRILSQCQILEEIRVYLNESKLNKHALQEFLGDIFTNRANIKYIFANFGDTNVCDDDICQFSLNLPQIRKFKLILQRTKVTNLIIEWLRRNLLTPMSCLENFHLSLNGTQITDTHMENLFSGFGKINNLYLDFGKTKITNKTLQDLSQGMSTFANSLQEFQIELHGTDVTDEGVALIFMGLPNVITLGFGLSCTKITDKSIKVLAQKTLSSAPRLDSFTFLLQKIAVTDNSLQQIFETLPKELTELELRLDFTRVTDISLVPFITDTIPAMNELNKFKISVSNTNVSSEVQTKIRELEDTINSNQ